MREDDLSGCWDEILLGGGESVSEEEVGGLFEEGEVGTKEGGNGFDV